MGIDGGGEEGGVSSVLIRLVKGPGVPVDETAEGGRDSSEGSVDGISKPGL